MEKRAFSIQNGPHAARQTPVTVNLGPGGLPAGVKLTDGRGQNILCQIEEENGDLFLTWIADMKPGESLDLQAELSTEAPETFGGVALKEQEGRIEILIDGQPWSAYHHGPEVARPYMYPIPGPGGLRVTRGYPMEDIPDQMEDHIHHKSFFVAHGDVNGTDNWSEGPDHGWTVHRKFLRLVSGPVYGRITARGEWMNKEKTEVILEEIRDIRICNTEPAPLIDMAVTLRAVSGKVVFGDTKEGGICGIRVASSMDVPRGGRIENAFGGTDELETWGARAHWCDYSGPVDDQTAGIAVMDHPDSFRYPTWWHVRNYGLMAANPFAWSYYTDDPENRGDHTLAHGDDLLFKYRLYLHRGNAGQARVAEKYNNFINAPYLVSEEGKRVFEIPPGH